MMAINHRPPATKHDDSEKIGDGRYSDSGKTAFRPYDLAVQSAL
jgi:hypothetical protein